MSLELPSSVAFGLSFVHPVLMWVLLALSGYGLFLGIKAKKLRTAATAEERKPLIKGQFALSPGAAIRLVKGNPGQGSK